MALGGVERCRENWMIDTGHVYSVRDLFTRSDDSSHIAHFSVVVPDSLSCSLRYTDDVGVEVFRRRDVLCSSEYRQLHWVQ